MMARAERHDVEEGDASSGTTFSNSLRSLEGLFGCHRAVSSYIFKLLTRGWSIGGAAAFALHIMQVNSRVFKARRWAARHI